jgi:hypothetical protein
MNEMITEDTEGGEFSFIEYNSGSGLLSAAVAERYPRATIISVETEDMHVEAHLRRLKRLAQSKVDIAGADLQSQRDGHGGGGGAESMQRLADVGANNWVCKTEESVHDMLTKLYESPEFVRYGVFTGDLVLEHMIDSKGYRELADPIGKLMSTAMTTFFSLPSARAISLALSTFFHVPAATSAPAMYALSAHPRPRYQNAEMQILSTIGRVPGKTKLSMRLIPGGSSQHMVRVDIVNMTRHVHHHFDYQKDGHQRRYKMHVLRNSTLTKLAAQMRKKQGSGGKPLAGDAYRKALAKMVPEGSHPNRGTVTSVYITREHDAWHIPYGTLYGITLITVLRLGVSTWCSIRPPRVRGFCDPLHFCWCFVGVMLVFCVCVCCVWGAFFSPFLFLFLFSCFSVVSLLFSLFACPHTHSSLNPSAKLRTTTLSLFHFTRIWHLGTLSFRVLAWPTLTMIRRT